MASSAAERVPCNYIVLSTNGVSLKANREHPGAFDILGCSELYTFKSASGVQDTALWIKAIKSAGKTTSMMLGTLREDSIEGELELDGRPVWVTMEQGFLVLRESQQPEAEVIDRLIIAGMSVQQDGDIVDISPLNGSPAPLRAASSEEAATWVEALAAMRQEIEAIVQAIREAAEKK